MFVCLGFGHFILFVYFFSLSAKLKRSANEASISLKTSIFSLPTPLRGCKSLLEIAFCRTV